MEKVGGVLSKIRSRVIGSPRLHGMVYFLKDKAVKRLTGTVIVSEKEAPQRLVSDNGTLVPVHNVPGRMTNKTS